MYQSGSFPETGPIQDIDREETYLKQICSHEIQNSMRQTVPSSADYFLCSLTLAFFRGSVNEKGIEKLHKICSEILCSPFFSILPALYQILSRSYVQYMESGSPVSPDMRSRCKPSGSGSAARTVRSRNPQDSIRAPQRSLSL